MYRGVLFLTLFGVVWGATIKPASNSAGSDQYTSSMYPTQAYEEDSNRGKSNCKTDTYLKEDECVDCPANTNSGSGAWDIGDCKNVCLWGNLIDKFTMRKGRKGTLTNTLYPNPGYGSNSHCYWTFKRPNEYDEVYMVVEITRLMVEPSRDYLILSRNYMGMGEDKTRVTSFINTYGEFIPEQTATSKTDNIYGHYFWKTTGWDDVNITFLADAEVNGPGFMIKYAFDDCIELDPLSNGYWNATENGGITYYIPICDDGYIARISTEGKKNRDPSIFFTVAEGVRYFPYCDKDDNSDNHLKWINNHYYCAKKLHNCYDMPMPMIKHAHLEFVSSPNAHTATYDVICDKFDNTVAGPSTLECGIVKESSSADKANTYDWKELYNEEWLYPRCVAITCDTIPPKPNIVVIDSKGTYQPGAYLRERCSLNIDDDETRWCMPNGEWTANHKVCVKPEA